MGDGDGNRTGVRVGAGRARCEDGGSADVVVTGRTRLGKAGSILRRVAVRPKMRRAAGRVRLGTRAAGDGRTGGGGGPVGVGDYAGGVEDVAGRMGEDSAVVEAPGWVAGGSDRTRPVLGGLGKGNCTTAGDVDEQLHRADIEDPTSTEPNEGSASWNERSSERANDSGQRRPAQARPTRLRAERDRCRAKVI